VVDSFGRLNKDVTQFFTGKPPSFTRSFYRSLFSQVVPPLKSEFLREIVPVLAPVFPALAYTGLADCRLQVTEALPISLLRLGYLKPEIGVQLQNEIKVHSWEAIAIVEELTRLPLAKLKTIMPWVNNQVNPDQLITSLLYSAVSHGSSIQFAKRVMEFLFKTFELSVLLTMICTSEFLENANFPCVFYIFRNFEAVLKKSDFPQFYEFAQTFRDSRRGFFADKFRKDVFATLDSVKTVAAVLHDYMNGE
jgi:hypothetical protein